jgi:hypothetical protein
MTVHWRDGLRKAVFAVLALAIFGPFMIQLICWLIHQWVTYLALVVASVVCYLRIRRHSGGRTSRSVRSGSFERVPYRHGLRSFHGDNVEEE